MWSVAVALFDFAFRFDVSSMKSARLSRRQGAFGGLTFFLAFLWLSAPLQLSLSHFLFAMVWIGRCNWEKKEKETDCLPRTDLR